MGDTTRKAKPTDADRAAAARLHRIWRELPRSSRPTQEALADRLDITQSAVSQYLRGLIPLNYRAVLGFAEALRCEPERIRTDLPEMRAAAKATLRVAEPALATYELLRAADWPFAFPRRRFDQLTQEQRSRIEGLVLGLIVEYEARSKRRRGRRDADDSHLASRVPMPKAGSG